jgi:hypothetical protein
MLIGKPLVSLHDPNENGMQAQTTTRDPLCRFTPTPLAVHLPVMGRTIRLETNSAAVLSHTQQLFRRYAGQEPTEPGFLWRIVSERDAGAIPSWPEVAVFSDDGLRYVSFGHRSFLAVDLTSREAIGFLPETLANDEAGFSAPFLERLFLLSAATLGLTSVGAACVGSGRRALFIFGPPKSGKTTACFLSTRLGLDFLADQSTLVEITSDGVRAWGEFWPAAFRPDALGFLPELAALTRPFRYRDSTFLYMEKSQTRGALPNQGHEVLARSVVPSGCVFLEREGVEPGMSPRLSRLTPSEFSRQVDGCLLFREVGRFDAQQTSVLRALECLPAYRLAYANDPGAIVPFFRRLLDSHRLEAGL